MYLRVSQVRQAWKLFPSLLGGTILENRHQTQPHPHQKVVLPWKLSGLQHEAPSSVPLCCHPEGEQKGPAVKVPTPRERGGKRQESCAWKQEKSEWCGISWGAWYVENQDDVGK